jgi:hypothetical protein
MMTNIPRPNYSAVCDEIGHILIKMPGMDYGISNAEEALRLSQTLADAIAKAWPEDDTEPNNA